MAKEKKPPKRKEQLMVVSNGGAYHGFAKLVHEWGKVQMSGRILTTADTETILDYRFLIEMTDKGPRLALEYADSNGKRKIAVEPEAVEPVFSKESAAGQTQTQAQPIGDKS